ncbi:MAG TPA: patatin-like phospholipase family protein, partial [Thermoanaerobaculia bacterium]|nr:patatin-like phospholipase family protein [Thermoanaerobaculia bacterium]
MGKLLSLQEVLEEEYEAIHGQPVPVRSEKLPALFTALHAKNQTALCLSGGGIRSATFALGVIQALAQRGSGAQSLLSKFHYLSTVSGGGYIGAWLSAYARRSGGIDEVADRLKAPPEDPANPEIKPIKHLRQFSNYLAPKLGFLSADTWTLIGTYLRNVSLTWLVLVPLFIAALMLPRFFVSLLRSEPHIGFVYLAAATAVVSYLLALWHLCKSRPVGDVPRYGNRRGDDARPYLTNGAFVWRAILPLLVCAVATSLAYGWCGHHRPKMPMWLIASIAVVISVVMSTYYMIRFRRAAKEGEELGNLRRDVKRKWFLRKKQAAELAAATISGLIGVAAAWSALTAHSFAPPFLPLKQPAAADWLNPATIFPPAGIALYVCFAVPILFGALIVQGTIFIAGASWFNEEYDREWWARAGAWCACAALAWMVITILALYGPVFIYYAPRTITGIGMISGGFAVLMGRSAKTAANRKQKEEEGLLGRSINLSLGLAVPVFAVCVLAALSLATTKLLQPFVSPPPMSVHDRNLLERTSWTYETKARKEPRLPLLDPGERTMKTIEMPAMEGDVFAARQHLYVVDHTDAGLAFLVIVFGVVLGGVASLFVGVNRFSMNALYRNRLIRAYLGASHMGRDPNPFTGFDPEDNMQLHELQPDFITAEDLVDAKAILGLLKKPPDHWLTVFAECVPKLTDLDQDSMLLDQRLARRLRDVVYERDLTRPWLPWLFPSEKTPLARVRNRRELEKRLNAGGEVICPLPRAPFHVINMALNLVGGKKELAWVERMAQSFTASPLHSGSESSVNRLGYRRSIEYGGPSGLSLGMAVSVSGAAASPNMGYHSSPALAFLMT